ncbi:MAG TPA: hypothetical protein VEA78_09345 [Acidimicrobiales bacterium]|nr:hypothetical protein [Acidimicrobiales bacterium]
MTTTEPRVTPGEVEPYIAAVRSLLWSLPEAERDELVEDVTAHLTELAAEADAPLAERLGPPSRYAAEFVASAGVEVKAPSVAWRDTRAVRGAVGERWHALRPAWLAVRPFLAVAAVLHLFDVGGWDDETFWALVLVAVFGALAVPMSMTLGRAGGWRDRALTVVAAVGGIAVAISLDTGPTVVYSDGGQPYFDGVYRDIDGAPLTNVWAYDRDGNPVEVFLYDELGRPLDLQSYETADQRTGEAIVTQLPTDPDRRRLVVGRPHRDGAPHPRPAAGDQHAAARRGAGVDHDDERAPGAGDDDHRWRALRRAPDDGRALVT